MKRRFLLDTNIASFVIKGSRPKIIERLSKQPRANVGVSVITVMELRFGLARLEDAQQLEQRVNEFLFAVPVLTLPEDIALSYGRVRAALETHGKGIGPLDTIIASHAVALGAVLVTNNLREFGRVKGLRLEDWT
ncbi:MAG: type II toxin-antitoxin system VapC family toxin [Archangium sp.]|nr:type II toxin-antitoxin system VapC family toxin [Archangium sp.]